MYELIAELIFLRNQQPADTQGIPPIWQKLVRSEGRPSCSPVLQALIFLSRAEERTFQQEARNRQVSGFFLCVLTKICRQ